MEPFNKLAEELSVRQHTPAQVRRARKLIQTVIGTNLEIRQPVPLPLASADIVLCLLRNTDTMRA